MPDEKLIFRKASVAGSFYSRDKLILERELSMLLEAAPLVDIPGKIRAIIVPHAGYLYSGGVAARAYSQILNQNYKKVIIIAPSHESEFEYSSIFNGAGYTTPFGQLSVDKDLAEKLSSISDFVRMSEIGHSAQEHAIEVQLPFLQSCLGKFQIIPIAMGAQTEEQIEALTAILCKVLPVDDTLLVASTDLSHNHPHERAKQKDQIAVEAIDAYDEAMLWREIQEGQVEMCGYGPTIVAMKTARHMGSKESRVLLYRDSGDISGNYSSVVGYLSAIIF